MSASLPAPTGSRSVSLANRHPRLRLDRRAIARAIGLLDANAALFNPRGARVGGCPAGELSLVFLTDAALAKLHADFLADPTVTDVITFAGDPALGLAGEICISADAAERHHSRTRESLAAAKSRRGPKSDDFGYRHPGEFSSELTLYLVHGWLHLAGYDDLQPSKKREMRRAEARALKLLRTGNALPVFAWS